MTDNALTLIEPKNIAQHFEPNGLDPIIAAIRAEVKGIVPDISTKKGRQEIASLAYKVAQSKTSLDNIGKQLVSGMKEQVKAIDAERSRAWDELEAIQKQVRAPLTEWENREKDRVAGHEAALAAIPEHPAYGQHETAAELQERIGYLEDLPPRDWQEFTARAAKILADEIDRTKALLTVARKRETEAAELARLRQEEADRKQREHEERLQAEAAAKARTEAEEQARREAEAEAARVREEQERAEQDRQRIQREKEEADRLAAEAEARAKKAEEDRLAAIAQAEADRKAAEEKAAADAIAAAEKARRDAEAAAQREREKIEAERKAEADALAAKVASEQKAAAEREAAACRQKEEAEARAAKAEADRLAAVAQAEADKAAAAEQAKHDIAAAAQREQVRIVLEQKREKDAQAAREADKAHRAKINGEAMAAILKAGAILDAEERAKAIVTAIAKGQISHVKICY